MENERDDKGMQRETTRECRLYGIFRVADVLAIGELVFADRVAGEVNT